MVQIDVGKPVFTVVVTMGIQRANQAQLVELAKTLIPVFRHQPGFISMALHRSLDGGGVISYLQWRSREDHEACQSNAEVIASGQKLMQFLDEHQATIEVHACEVVAVAEAD